MRGGSVGSASAAAPWGVNPFDAKRRALIRPLDLPREVEGKVESSRSVCVGVRGYTRVPAAARAQAAPGTGLVSPQG